MASSECSALSSSSLSTLRWVAVSRESIVRANVYALLCSSLRESDAAPGRSGLETCRPHHKSGMDKYPDPLRGFGWGFSDDAGLCSTTENGQIAAGLGGAESSRTLEGAVNPGTVADPRKGLVFGARYVVKPSECK